MPDFINFRLENLESIRKQYDPKIVDRALSTAMTRTAMKARTAVSRLVRQTYNIKARHIRTGVRLIRRKRGQAHERVLLYTGTAIPLNRFDPLTKRVLSARGPRVGVTVRIRKDRGRKLVTGGFLADVNGAKVFIRRPGAAKTTTSKGRYAGTGIKRQPIDRQFSVSVPGTVAHQSVLNEINKVVAEQAPIEFNRAMNFFTDRFR